MSSKKRGRDSEIALLERISTSLDSFNNASDRRRQRVLAVKENDPSKLKTQRALALKTLVRNIVKICTREKTVQNVDIDTSFGMDRLIGEIVEEYVPNYPSLTVEMVTEAMSRYSPSSDADDDDDDDGNNSVSSCSDNGGEVNDEAEQLFLRKVGRCITKIDEEMDAYYEKIKAMKLARLQAPIEAQGRVMQASVATIARGEPARWGDDTRQSADKNQLSNPTKQGPTRKSRKKPSKKKAATPENILLNKVLDNYFQEKEKHRDKFPRGCVDEIIAKTKEDLKMTHVPFSKAKMRHRIINDRRNKQENNQGMTGSEEVNMEKVLFDEIYARYASEKELHGDKLPPHVLDTIIEETKAKLGMPDAKVRKGRIRYYFTKNHPTFPCNGVPSNLMYNLSEEDKRKKQHLLNEITRRYVEEKEKCEGNLLPHGAINRLIQSTKEELGMTHVKVEKSTIFGRIHRGSHQVMTLGSDTPYNAIDEPLIDTINLWLSKGMSVTRAQGLEVANSLLMAHNLKHRLHSKVVLDARWWACFIERNKRRLTGAVEDK